MALPNSNAVSSLAYHLNAEIPSFRSLSLSEYASSALFAQLASSPEHAPRYKYAFGNLSISEIRSSIATIDHGIMGLASTKAAMAIMGVMLAMVGLRVYSRIKVLPGRLRMEDWLVIIATGLNWSLMMLGGNGHHMYDVSEETLSTHLRLMFVFLLLYHPTILAVKLAVLLFFSSLYPSTRTARVSGFVLTALFFVGGVAFFMGGMLTCMPLDFWNHLSDVKTDCGNIELRQDVLGIFSTVTDGILMGLGIFLAARTTEKACWRKMCGLGIIFAFSLLWVSSSMILAATINRIFTVRKYDTSPDFTHYGPQAAFLFIVEPMLAIIAISLPAVRALFVHLFKAHSSASNHMSGTTYTGDATPRKRRWSWKWRQSGDVNVNEVDVEADGAAAAAAVTPRASRWVAIKEKMGDITEVSHVWFKPRSKPKAQCTSAQNEWTGSTQHDDAKSNHKNDALPPLQIPVDDKEDASNATDLEAGVSPRSGGNLSDKYREDSNEGSSSYYFPYTRRSGSTDANSNPLYVGPPGPPPKVPLPDIPTRPLTPSTASSIACDYEIERQRSHEAATYSMYQYSNPALGSKQNGSDDNLRANPNFRFSEPLPSHIDGGSGSRESMGDRIMRHGQERSMSVPDSQAELRRLGSSSELKGLSPRPPPRK